MHKLLRPDWRLPRDWARPWRDAPGYSGCCPPPSPPPYYYYIRPRTPCGSCNLPDSLLATLSTGAVCSELNGLSAILTKNPLGPSWNGTVPACATHPPGETHGFNLQLSCLVDNGTICAGGTGCSLSGSQLVLSVSSTAGFCHSINGACGNGCCPDAGCTCSPILLVYTNAFSISGAFNGLCCGCTPSGVTNFATVTITEAP